MMFVNLQLCHLTTVMSPKPVPPLVHWSPNAATSKHSCYLEDVKKFSLSFGSLFHSFSNTALKALFGDPRTMTINKMTFIILTFPWVFVSSLPPLELPLCFLQNQGKCQWVPSLRAHHGACHEWSREMSRDGHICKHFGKKRRRRRGDVENIQIFTLFVSFWVCLK